jgi:hypothetical protein
MNPTFEIYSATSRERYAEGYSWVKTHHIAHLMLDDWPDRAPLVILDRVNRQRWKVNISECDVLYCEVMEVRRSQAEYARGEYVTGEEIRARYGLPPIPCPDRRGAIILGLASVFGSG